MSSNYELFEDSRKPWCLPRVEKIKSDVDVEYGSLTTAQRLALPTTDGLEVYDSDLGQFYFHQGGVWTPFIANNNASSLSLTITTSGAVITPIQCVFTKVGKTVQLVIAGFGTSATFGADHVYLSIPEAYASYGDVGGSGLVSVNSLGASNGVDCQTIVGIVGRNIQISRLASNQIAAFQSGLGSWQRCSLVYCTSF